MSGGWIKLHRQIHDSPMYREMNSKQRDVMIQILLLVNHKERDWMFKGTMYKVRPGQCVTSLQSIKDRCAPDVTIQTIRTAITNMQAYGFLTSESTNKNRLITICKWDEYQDELTNELTGNQQTNQQATNKQLTTNKNDKNDKKKEYLTPLPPYVEQVPAMRDDVRELWDYWHEQLGPITRNQTFQRNALSSLQRQHGVDRVKKMIRVAAAAHVEKFTAKHLKIAGPKQLEEQWDALYLWAKGKSTKQVIPGL